VTPISFECRCGGREEIADPALLDVPPAARELTCSWCRGPMRPFTPRFTPPDGSGRLLTDKEKAAMTPATAAPPVGQALLL